MSQNQPIIKVIQLSDPHLFSNPNCELAGLNTHDSFTAVLDHLSAHHAPFDLLMVTGDIAQDTQYRKAYEHFIELVSPLHVPVLTVPGNHDNPAILKEILSKSSLGWADSYQFKGWDFILLDTSVPNQAFGQLSTAELVRLERALSTPPFRPTLIAMHHQPVLINSEWIKSLELRNSAEFFACIDRYDHVKGVIFGHIHQNHESTRGSLSLYSTPSTCIQFKAEQHTFGLDPQAPGYRWYYLYADGTIKSGVERLPLVPETIDFSMIGYE